MDLGDFDTKTVVTGIGILLVGGFGAFATFAGSELLLNDSSNVGDLVTAVSEGDVQGVVDNLFGDETAAESENINTSEEEQVEDNSPETQISLSDARQAALDFVGEGEIISSQESTLDAYAFEFEIELSDGGTETVFVDNNGNADLI